MSFKLFAPRSLEREALNRVKRRLPDARVIVEAGAHNGADTARLAKLFPRATIHAFECVPSLRVQAQAATAGLANVRIHPQALSNTCGTAPFFVSAGGSDQSSSLLRAVDHASLYPDVTFDDEITVETTTLDAWAAANGVPGIDFAWLDMQGMEPATLAGSPAMLATMRAVYSEVTFGQLYEGTPRYGEFAAWMQSQGFKVDLEDRCHEAWGNVLFVR